MDRAALKDRWIRLRNYQSRDFWAMVFARPLTILFLLPIADWKWVTPNRLTILSIMTKLGGIALLALDRSFSGGVWAVVLVNLGLVLDNMDGTLARYRRCGTFFGYYLDKVSDAATLVLLFWAMGYRAYLVSHEVWDLLLPAMGVGGAMVAAYSRWVADRVETDQKLETLAGNGGLRRWARERVDHDRSVPVPDRGLAGWLRWLGWALFSILLFNEVDIFFWVGLALITEHHWVFTRVLCPIYALGMIVGPVNFALKLWSSERTG